MAKKGHNYTLADVRLPVVHLKVLEVGLYNKLEPHSGTQ